MTSGTEKRKRRWLPEAHLGEVETFLDRLKLEPSQVTIPDQNITPNGKRRAALHKDWPHAPVHRLSDHGTFTVTASTLGNEHLFQGPDRLTLLEGELLRLAKQCEVLLEAWAIFSNHYHFVAHTTEHGTQLGDFLAELHSKAATELNAMDAAPGRPVWFNYWDIRLTFQKSYLARLNHVHQNAVKHRLVQQAAAYPWCSAAWFELTASAAQIQTIYSFKTDRPRIHDDYEPLSPWR